MVWYRRTWVLALLGSVLLYAAMPPLNLWPLAWAAPVPWLLLVSSPRLTGRRPYLVLWAAGFLYWMVLLQSVRMPHWTLFFGWLALSFYLALYLPMFIGLARVAVQRFGISLVIAAPVVWTGLELARGRLLTGFSLALLGHTQVDWAALVQIADVFGAYGVGFLVMLGAASLVRALWPVLCSRDRRLSLWPVVTCAVAIGAAALYGHMRLDAADVPAAGKPPLRVGLVQGTVDVVFDHDPQRDLRTFGQYRGLTLEARRAHPHIQLFVWPESAFAIPDPTGRYTVSETLVDDRVAVPGEVRAAGVDEETFLENIRAMEAFFAGGRRELAAELNAAVGREQAPASLLVGTQTVRFGSQRPDHYNAALLLTPTGKVADRYYKVHPVMFGEYIPFADSVPWIYSIAPLSHGLTRGSGPQAFEIDGWHASPSICFESTVPHLIRRQVARLKSQGQAPDVLVNLTNDGWFWGSNILDLHFTCGRFRAIENRRPFLVAANTGLSGWIDGSGRVRATLPRRTSGVVVADVEPDGRAGLYQQWGDLPAGICLACCLALAVGGWWPKR